LDAIRGGIAPSPFAGVGANVIRAIAGYAGRRVTLRRNGKLAAGYPLTEQMRFTIAPPGVLPLRSTMFSLVDVPDLRALAGPWPETNSVWIGAGPVPEALHRALVAFAWLVKIRLIPSLSPLAPAIHFVAAHLRWGDHRGGMFVEVDGVNASGAPARRSWHLVAEGDDGPLIPCMAVEAVVRKVLDGRSPPAGARTSACELDLQDYEPLFARRTIRTGVRVDSPVGEAPLYARILGTAWEALPAEIRAIHDVDRGLSARGRASVERGRGILAALLGQVMGFPKGGRRHRADCSVRGVGRNSGLDQGVRLRDF
jgi:hypothetical protein